MPDYKDKLNKHGHTNALIQLFHSLNYCIICSAFFFNKPPSYDSHIKTIKPNNFINKNENISCSLWTLEEKNNAIIFLNKKGYLKQRAPLIKNMKNICSYFSLSLKTYFLSIEYLDKISSKILNFNPKNLFQISLLCLILAAKFNESGPKLIHLQAELKKDLSKHYLEDEIYVLKLLNYKLNVHTSYDKLMEILYFGFIFEGEDCNYGKMNYFYSYLEKILYIFSEVNSYINMTSNQIALGIIGYARELLGLTPFNESIKKIYLINQKNEKFYNLGLEIIKKKIKIEGKIKTDSNTVKNKNKKEAQNPVSLFYKEFDKIGK